MTKSKDFSPLAEFHFRDDDKIRKKKIRLISKRPWGFFFTYPVKLRSHKEEDREN